MYQALLNDARFHQQLLQFDREIAAAARDAGCAKCRGTLHSARFGRKPRGVPAGLGDEYRLRFSFCCAVDGCRGRMTPSSLRFLGPKVYLATVVTMVTALAHPRTTDRRESLQGFLPAEAEEDGVHLVVRVAQGLRVHRGLPERLAFMAQDMIPTCAFCWKDLSRHRNSRQSLRNVVTKVTWIRS